MLFVQELTLRYQKDVRYANFANQRKSVRFWELPESPPEENEIFFQKIFMWQTPEKLACYQNQLKAYGTEGFFGGGFNNTPFSGRIGVIKEENNYRIQYCDKKNLGFYTTRFLLKLEEYGRMIFNERGAFDYTGIWYYDLITYNFINTSYDNYRKNLFFRKEPDHEFKDMQYLRYCQ